MFSDIKEDLQQFCSKWIFDPESLKAIPEKCPPVLTKTLDIAEQFVPEVTTAPGSARPARGHRGSPPPSLPPCWRSSVFNARRANRRAVSSTGWTSRPRQTSPS